MVAALVGLSFTGWGVGIIGFFISHYGTTQKPWPNSAGCQPLFSILMSRATHWPINQQFIRENLVLYLSESSSHPWCLSKNQKKKNSKRLRTGLNLLSLLYCNNVKPSYFNAIQYMQFFQVQTKYFEEKNQIPWNTSSKQILFKFIKVFILSYKKCPYQCYQFTCRHANLSRICRVRNEILVLSVEYPCNWNLLAVLYHTEIKYLKQQFPKCFVARSDCKSNVTNFFSDCLRVVFDGIYLD